MPADGFPNTFVPGRNLFFLSIAAVYARNMALTIVTGVSQTDFSGYPDCRDAFIKSLNVTLNLAMDEQFVLHTPLMWIDKAQTWALADELEKKFLIWSQGNFLTFIMAFRVMDADIVRHANFAVKVWKNICK